MLTQCVSAKKDREKKFLCKSNPEVWYKFYRFGCRKSQKKKLLLRYGVTVQALRSTITPSKKVKKKVATTH